MAGLNIRSGQQDDSGNHDWKSISFQQMHPCKDGKWIQMTPSQPVQLEQSVQAEQQRRYEQRARNGLLAGVELELAVSS